MVKEAKKVKKEAKKATPNNLELVKELAQKLIDLLEVDVKLQVEEKDESIVLNLETEDSGILIGYHGEALFAFQRILSLMVYKKTGEWLRITVDVGDYRQRREEALERMALSIAQKVKFSGEEQLLPPMNAVERRIIHLVLANNPDVKTESEDEGSQRHVVVKPSSSL